MRNTAPTDAAQLEALETREWLDSLDDVLKHGGPARVGSLLRELGIHAQKSGVRLPFTANTPYINTINADEQVPYPGSREIERRIKSIVRWNAMAMVVRANKLEDGIGGHISTFASSATLYEVGYNHFFRGRDNGNEGDVVYFQGHGSPGIYARAFLEGRLDAGTADQLPPRVQPGRRAVVVSASVADAGFLGIPDRLDGPRPDHGDLPGALQSLPRRSRPQAEDRRQGVGVPRRRRDRRARIARRHHARVARKARQPDLRDQLQPAAPRRPGARQRPDHPGARSDLPRRRLERDQVHLGHGVGRPAREGSRGPARQAHGRGRRRRVPEVRRRDRRLRSQAFLGRASAAARNGQAPLRRAAQEADARRPRSRKGLQRVQARHRNQGHADPGARPHHQGLRRRRIG